MGLKKVVMPQKKSHKSLFLCKSFNPKKHQLKIKRKRKKFNRWVLKNVTTKDCSEAVFDDLRKLRRIESFDKSQLRPTKTSTSDATQLFVSELLSKEIQERQKQLRQTKTSTSIPTQMYVS